MSQFIVGLGGQKCASSWLFECLADHPGFFGKSKDLHFFSRELNWSKGLDWYRSHFEGCIEPFFGEFSTSYLYSEVAISRISKHFPDAKVLVCLRNPYERTYSHYKNKIMRGDVLKDTSFLTALSQHSDLLSHSLYFTHLSNIYKYFPLTNIHLIIFDDIKTKPHTVIRDLYEFVGLSDIHIPKGLNKVVNQSTLFKSTSFVRLSNRLASTLRHYKLHSAINYAKQIGIIEFARTLNKSRHEFQKPLYTADIVERMNQDIDDCEALINKNLQQWKK